MAYRTENRHPRRVFAAAPAIPGSPGSPGSGAMPLVLMYHSITPYMQDPYLVTVSPPRFEQQMSWLRRRGLRGTSVRELLAAAERGEARSLVGLSFDDGYADLVEYVVPVLRRHVFDQVRVAVVEGEANQAAGLAALGRGEQLPHGGAAQPPPAQPRHLLLEPWRADSHQVWILHVGRDRVIHQHQGHGAAARAARAARDGRGSGEHPPRVTVLGPVCHCSRPRCRIASGRTLRERRGRRPRPSGRAGLPHSTEIPRLHSADRDHPVERADVSLRP